MRGADGLGGDVVGSVGQRASLQDWVVVQRSGDPQPPGGPSDFRWSGSTFQQGSPVLRRLVIGSSGVVGQGGLLDVGLVLGDLERTGQVEDRPLRLAGHHPPSGERPAGADPVHLVPDRLVAGSPADEVGVEGVDGTVGLHRGRSGAQSLGYHLAAVHPAPRVVGTDAHVDVGAVGFEGHQGGEVSDLESHGPCGGSAVKCHGHVEGDAVGHAVLVEPHPVGMARWGGQRILHVGRADTEESHRARNLLE